MARLGSKEIEEAASSFGINPTDVEKDYIYGWILKALYEVSELRERLILKGGSALRKGYLSQTRFSKDMDFSTQEELDQTLLRSELERVCDFVSSNTDVRFFPDRTLVKDKELPIPDVQALEARVYFKGFYREENIVLKAQLDVTEFDRLYLPVQSRELIHPYSDSDACTSLIRCQKIEEILASKLNTLLQRRKAGDLFDLLYAILFRQEYPISRREVVSTFLRKSLVERSPASAKEQLLAVPLNAFRGLWSTIIAPTGSLFDFDYALSNFAALIEDLFSLVLGAPAPALVPGVPSRGRFGPLGRGFQPVPWFSANVRQAIMDAAAAMTLVEIIYDGVQRLVEPYKLEYRVRKRDGVGLEYFWGYDTTGGRSGPGIKQFICEKIASARSTSILFTPRWPVEM